MVTEETKTKELIGRFKKHDTDTGSSAVQIVSWTEKIRKITKHLQENKKDFSTKRGLFRLLARRRSLLRYLAKHDADTCKRLLEEFNLKLK